MLHGGKITSMAQQSWLSYGGDQVVCANFVGFVVLTDHATTGKSYLQSQSSQMDGCDMT